MKGEVEGDTDTVLGWIRNAKGLCVGLSFSESDFLDDLVKAVPVFIKEGTNYRWSHKSLAEYFAAQYVCTEGKQTQDKIFSSMWEDERLYHFKNVLDQIYDLDISAFRKHFILPVAREFSNYWATTYKNLSTTISSEDINLRKSICFGMKYQLSGNLNQKTVTNFNNIIEKFRNESQFFKNNDTERPFSVTFGSIKTKGNSSYPYFIFSIHSPCAVILHILEEKKDPLIQSKSRVDLSIYKSVLTKKALRKIAEVSDDVNNELNSKRNFNAVTKLILSHTPCVLIDHEKFLKFENTLQDEAKVENFADELISSIK